MILSRPDRRSQRRLARVTGKARETGQAAMGMVIGLILLLSLSGAMLGATAIQHDPLVSNDVIQHLAYRALQSGIDSYLSAANQSPNLVNCNSSNESTCGIGSSQLAALNAWKTVAGTSSNPVTESYMWTNPALCFNSACSAVSTTAGQTLQYVRELVYGKASIGTSVSYQSSYLNLEPENGFLTHVFWSNYESTVPASGQTSNCTYDWNDSYEGPDTTDQGDYGSSNCAAVFFGPNDVLDGPVYSNDSIYVDSSPNFGPSSDPATVTTHDPNCLFVAPLAGAGSQTTCSGATADVGNYNSATSSDNAQFEPIPSTDTSLETIAAQDGCVYAGPTTITLASTGTLTVSSPDTPYTTSSGTQYNQTSGTNQLLDSTNTNACGAGGSSSVSSPANGVIYVETVPGSCPNSSVSTNYDYWANPFDGPSAGSSTDSQLGYYYGQTSTPDCEGDAFVHGNETGDLTIATQNDIVVDGSLTYSDCGSSFNSTFADQCPYNSGANSVNDALGLIAFSFVEVDRPVSVSNGNTSVLSTCGSNGAEPLPLCDPSGGSGMTIDAAILALNDGFGVNNYTTSGTEGTLTVYGTVDEDYRPAVGTFSGSSLYTGYSKYYLWDSRLGYVNVPDYLNPGTPLWEISSTAVNQGVACTTSTALPGVWTSTDNYGSYPNSPGSCASP